MAIFGKLCSLAPLFSKTVELESLCVYLHSALDQTHPHHQNLMQQEVGSLKLELDHGMHAMQIVYHPTQGVLETHRRFIDFLLVVQGCEMVILADRTDLCVQTPYDPNTDQETYQASPHLSQVCMHAGMLGVFLEYDAHTTCPLDAKLVRKVVVKVPRELVKLKL
ncbi:MULTISPECIES: YhcH/YjgK/YiaL family protein [Helicobacter]|uniref:YhcH/YjgK/YiaL family protein n=1 Tax=Helicobacter TaxID=209 RepID=UPI000EAF01FE|nr:MULTISPECIES: YhcH/YjgK/YiaL family protein [Helicobacter]